MSEAVRLEPGLRLLRAPNPSPMTHTGTNTYLLGDGPVAVIDPGPDDDDHLAAILSAVGGRGVEAILVTHAHLDHSPLARRLAAETGAPVMAYGDASAGRSATMASLQGLEGLGGGEGVDSDFIPDRILADGEHVAGTGWSLEALWTPGHFGNHMCFAWGDAIFTGDLVMGWASSLVSPPDGDLTDFMASCARLRARPGRVLHPGHGAPVTDPAARLDWLIGHRREREAQILAALGTGPADAATLARAIYTGIEPRLLPAAARNVLAHLIDLTVREAVEPIGEIDAKALFRRV